MAINSQSEMDVEEEGEEDMQLLLGCPLIDLFRCQLSPGNRPLE